jgi:hypothetical protein
MYVINQTGLFLSKKISTKYTELTESCRAGVGKLFSREGRIYTGLARGIAGPDFGGAC